MDGGPDVGAAVPKSVLHEFWLVGPLPIRSLDALESECFAVEATAEQMVVVWERPFPRDAATAGEGAAAAQGAAPAAAAPADMVPHHNALLPAFLAAHGGGGPSLVHAISSSGSSTVSAGPWTLSMCFHRLLACVHVCDHGYEQQTNCNPERFGFGWATCQFWPARAYAFIVTDPKLILE